MENADRRMRRAISPGVFCRVAFSTRPIILSTNVLPCSAVIRTTMRSLMTFVPSGDRAPVSAGFADHGRRLARDRRLVDARDPFDHLSVAGNHVSGLADHAVTDAQLDGGDFLLVAVAASSRRAMVFVRMARSESARALPWISARDSEKFANRTVNHSQMAIWRLNPS